MKKLKNILNGSSQSLKKKELKVNFTLAIIDDEKNFFDFLNKNLKYSMQDLDKKISLKLIHKNFFKEDKFNATGIINQVIECNPNAILMDLVLHKIKEDDYIHIDYNDAIRLIRKLKNNHSLKILPIVIVSRYITSKGEGPILFKEIEQELRACGVSGVFAKSDLKDEKVLEELFQILGFEGKE